MLLFHFPDEHPELLGLGVSQFDVELMSPFASSDKMNVLGGLVTINSDIGLYTKEDIENYLNELAKKIDDTSYDSVEPIGFHLANYDHAVGLIYNKTAHQWTFKDIDNESSLLSQDILTTKEISREIFKGFEPAPSEELIESTLDELPKNLAPGEFGIGRSIVFDGKTAQVSYQKEPEKWILNGKSITKQDVVQGLYRIFHGEKSLSPYIAFHTSIITTAKNKKQFNLQTQLASFKTPLHITAESVHMDACNELVAVAAAMKREDIIIALINHGMDVNQRLDNDNSTLAHQASHFGLMSVLETLAKHGANFNVATLVGHTPLIYAVWYSQHDVFHWLLEHRVDLDAQAMTGSTAMYVAAKKGDVDVIHALANHGAKLDIPLRESGEAPIHVAAKNGHLHVIDALIEHGANINAQMKDGQTAVYLVANYGSAQAVCSLAEKGADLNVSASTGGETPAWIAAYNGHFNVIQELFKYHADLDRPNKSGVSPLFVAARNGHIEIVRFLLTNSQSLPMAFISTTEVFKQFAQSRGEKVVQRMHEMLELKLSSGEDNDHISLFPQEIAWVMDHQAVVQAFSVKVEKDLTKAYKESLESQKQAPLPKEDHDPDDDQDPPNHGNLHT